MSKRGRPLGRKTLMLCSGKSVASLREMKNYLQLVRERSDDPTSNKPSNRWHDPHESKIRMVASSLGVDGDDLYNFLEKVHFFESGDEQCANNPNLRNLVEMYSTVEGKAQMSTDQKSIARRGQSLLDCSTIVANVSMPIARAAPTLLDFHIGLVAIDEFDVATVQKNEDNPFASILKTFEGTTIQLAVSGTINRVDGKDWVAPFDEALAGELMRSGHLKQIDYTFLSGSMLDPSERLQNAYTTDEKFNKIVEAYKKAVDSGPDTILHPLLAKLLLSFLKREKVPWSTLVYVPRAKRTVAAKAGEKRKKAGGKNNPAKKKSRVSPALPLPAVHDGEVGDGSEASPFELRTDDDDDDSLDGAFDGHFDGASNVGSVDDVPPADKKSENARTNALMEKLCIFINELADDGVLVDPETGQPLKAVWVGSARAGGKAANDEAFRAFDSGEARIMLNYDMINRGSDFPHVGAVVLMRTFDKHAQSAYEQIIARAMRTLNVDSLKALLNEAGDGWAVDADGHEIEGLTSFKYAGPEGLKKIIANLEGRTQIALIADWNAAGNYKRLKQFATDHKLNPEQWSSRPSPNDNTSAAEVMQKWVRGKKARMHYAQQRAAVCILQRAGKRYRVRQLLRETWNAILPRVHERLYARQCMLAIRRDGHIRGMVQSMWSTIQELLAKRAAARRINAIWRDVRIRRLVRGAWAVIHDHDLLNRHRAACRLQHAFRSMMRLRRHFHLLINHIRTAKRLKAAVYLQHFVRDRRIRRMVQAVWPRIQHLLRKIAAGSCIAAIWRDVRIHRLVRATLQTIRGERLPAKYAAARRIAIIWRDVRIRRLVRGAWAAIHDHDLLNRHRAACRLQHAFRSMMRFRRHFHLLINHIRTAKRLKAAVYLQHFVRDRRIRRMVTGVWNAMMAHPLLLERRGHRNALRIQVWCRGHLSRLSVKAQKGLGGPVMNLFLRRPAMHGPIHNRPWRFLSDAQIASADALGFDQISWDARPRNWAARPGFDELTVDQLYAVHDLEFLNPLRHPADRAGVYNPRKPAGKRGESELVGYSSLAITQMLGPSRPNGVVFPAPSQPDVTLEEIIRDVHEGTGEMGSFGPTKALDPDRRRILRQMSVRKWHPIAEVTEALIDDDVKRSGGRRCSHFLQVFDVEEMKTQKRLLKKGVPSAKAYVKQSFRNAIRRLDLQCETDNQSVITDNSGVSNDRDPPGNSPLQHGVVYLRKKVWLTLSKDGQQVRRKHDLCWLEEDPRLVAPLAGGGGAHANARPMGQGKRQKVAPMPCTRPGDWNRCYQEYGHIGLHDFEHNFRKRGGEKSKKKRPLNDEFAAAAASPDECRKRSRVNRLGINDGWARQTARAWTSAPTGRPDPAAEMFATPVATANGAGPGDSSPLACHLHAARSGKMDEAHLIRLSRLFRLKGAQNELYQTKLQRLIEYLEARLETSPVELDGLPVAEGQGEAGPSGAQVDADAAYDGVDDDGSAHGRVGDDDDEEAMVAPSTTQARRSRRIIDDDDDDA